MYLSVEQLHCEIIETGHPWYHPLCTEDDDGMPMMEWQIRGRRLTFMLEKQGVTYSTLYRDSNGKFIGDEGAADTKEQRQVLWNWLMSDEEA